MKYVTTELQFGSILRRFDSTGSQNAVIGWWAGLARQEGSDQPFITYKGIKLEF